MAEELIDLVLDYRFDAPPARVYEAFIDPDLISAWFGPVGFSVPRPTVSVEPRVGGHQRFTMVADNNPAVTSPVDATFTELVPGSRIAGVEVADGVAGAHGPVELKASFDFLPEGDGTRLELVQGPYTREIEEQARIGWLSSFTKLERLLADPQ